MHDEWVLKYCVSNSSLIITIGDLDGGCFALRRKIISEDRTGDNDRRYSYYIAKGCTETEFESWLVELHFGDWVVTDIEQKSYRVGAIFRANGSDYAAYRPPNSRRV